MFGVLDAALNVIALGFVLREQKIGAQSGNSQWQLGGLAQLLGELDKVGVVDGRRGRHAAFSGTSLCEPNVPLGSAER